jgi:hypothetical protein
LIAYREMAREINHIVRVAQDLIDHYADLEPKRPPTALDLVVYQASVRAANQLYQRHMTL